MKLLFTLLLSICMAPLSAQIYNGNFENWISFEGALLLQGWEIYANGDNPSVTQDTDAYEGMYAARVEAIPIPLGAYGNASTVFGIDEIPPSLDFYVKAASEFGSVFVEIIFYNGEETVDSFLWSSAQEEIVDWTFVNLPLEQDLPEVTTARINITAQVGDFAPGSAVISVDQMSFGTNTGVREQSEEVLNLYPNPASDVFRVSNATEVDYIEISDLSGKLVRRISGVAAQGEISVRDLAPASYVVTAHMISGTMGRQKLLVTR